MSVHAWPTVRCSTPSSCGTHCWIKQLLVDGCRRGPTSSDVYSHKKGSAKDSSVSRVACNAQVNLGLTRPDPKRESSPRLVEPKTGRAQDWSSRQDDSPDKAQVKGREFLQTSTRVVQIYMAESPLINSPNFLVTTTGRGSPGT